MHAQFTPENVHTLRTQYPGIVVLAHPECAPDVCAECDYVGSTKGMADYVARSSAQTFGLLTELGLVNRLQVQHPHKQFVWSAGVCSYMKKNTLLNIWQALADPRAEQIVTVDEAVAAAAKKSIDKMFELTK